MLGIKKQSNYQFEPSSVLTKIVFFFFLSLQKQNTYCKYMEIYQEMPYTNPFSEWR